MKKGRKKNGSVNACPENINRKVNKRLLPSMVGSYFSTKIDWTNWTVCTRRRKEKKKGKKKRKKLVSGSTLMKF